MPADPDAAIRERLDNPKRYLKNGVEPLINAITAVLEMKRRRHDDWTHFEETAYEAGQCWALEQVVDEIAEALGISVDDA